MPFQVEDGTGLTNSNAYVDVAFVDGYFLDRAISSWKGSNQAKEAAIIIATEYIDARFKFKGLKLKEDQSLEFPRKNTGCNCDGIPSNIKKATAEYALRSINGDLAPDPVIDESGFAITSKKERVGPIEETTGYKIPDYGDPWENKFRPYPYADALVEKCCVSSVSNVQFLGRA